MANTIGLFEDDEVTPKIEETIATERAKADAAQSQMDSAQGSLTSQYMDQINQILSGGQGGQEGPTPPPNSIQAQIEAIINPTQLGRPGQKYLDQAQQLSQQTYNELSPAVLTPRPSMGGAERVNQSKLDWASQPSTVNRHGGAPTYAPGAASDEERTALARWGQFAVDAGFGEEGSRVLQAIIKTEGGWRGAIGDTSQSAVGSHGALQFFGTDSRPGQLNAFRNWMNQNGANVDLAGAGKYARENQDVAVRWALNGYLGDKLRLGLSNGLSGPELATFVQEAAQVSDYPERAGANYTALFSGGGTGAGVPTTVELDPNYKPDKSIPPAGSTLNADYDPVAEDPTWQPPPPTITSESTTNLINPRAGEAALAGLETIGTLGLNIPVRAMASQEQRVAALNKAEGGNYEDQLRSIISRYGPDSPEAQSYEAQHNALVSKVEGDKNFWVGAEADPNLHRNIGIIGAGLSPIFSPNAAGAAAVAGGVAAPFIAQAAGGTPEQQELAGAAGSILPFAPSAMRTLAEAGGAVGRAWRPPPTPPVNVAGRLGVANTTDVGAQLGKQSAGGLAARVAANIASDVPPSVVGEVAPAAPKYGLLPIKEFKAAILSGDAELTDIVSNLRSADPKKAVFGKWFREGDQWRMGAATVPTDTMLSKVGQETPSVQRQLQSAVFELENAAPRPPTIPQSAAQMGGADVRSAIGEIRTRPEPVEPFPEDTFTRGSKSLQPPQLEISKEELATAQRGVFGRAPTTGEFGVGRYAPPETPFLGRMVDPRSEDQAAEMLRRTAAREAKYAAADAAIGGEQNSATSRETLRIANNRRIAADTADNLRTDLATIDNGPPGTQEDKFRNVVLSRGSASNTRLAKGETWRDRYVALIGREEAVANGPTPDAGTEKMYSGLDPSTLKGLIPQSVGELTRDLISGAVGGSVGYNIGDDDPDDPLARAKRGLAGAIVLALVGGPGLRRNMDPLKLRVLGGPDVVRQRPGRQMPAPFVRPNESGPVAVDKSAIAALDMAYRGSIAAIPPKGTTARAISAANKRTQQLFEDAEKLRGAGVTLTATEHEQLTDYVTRLASFGRGAIEQQRSVDRALNRAKDVGVPQALMEIGYSSMVAGVRTINLNMIGSPLQLLINRAVNTGMDLGGSIRQATGRPSSTDLNVTVKEVQGMLGAVLYGVEGWAQTLIKGDSAELRNLKGSIGDLSPTLKGTLMPSHILRAFDEFWRQIAYGGHIGRTAALELRDPRTGKINEAAFKSWMQNNPYKARTEAYDAANRVLYKGEFGPRVKQFLTWLDGPAAEETSFGTFMKYAFAPFFNVASKIDLTGLQMTPIGLGSAISDATARGAKSPYQRLNKTTGLFEAYRPEHLAPLTERIPQGVAGSLFMIYAFNKALNDGWITGAGPDSPDERKAMTSRGWAPWSFNINGNHVSYANLGPIAVPLGIAALAAENIRDEMREHRGSQNFDRAMQNLQQQMFGRTVVPTELTQGVGSAIGWTPGALRDAVKLADDLSPLQGLMTLGSLLDSTSVEAAASKLAGSLAFREIPLGNLWKTFAEAGDEWQREPTRPLDQLLQYIPGKRQEVDIKRGPSGELLKSQVSGARAFLPFRVNSPPEEADALRDELAAYGVTPDSAISRKVGGTTLNDVDYKKYRNLAYQYAETELISTINSQKYRNAKDLDKKNMLEAAISKGHASAAGKFVTSQERRWTAEDELEFKRERLAPPGLKR